MNFLHVGATFEGIVTQSGTMRDGNTYKAIQDCTINVLQNIPPNHISCEIVRKERKKYVNDTSLLSPQLPVNLQQYLSSFGSSREYACGVLHNKELLVLDGCKPHSTVPSDVQWSPHKYYLQHVGPLLLGLAVNQDPTHDRIHGLGWLMLHYCNKSE